MCKSRCLPDDQAYTKDEAVPTRRSEADDFNRVEEKSSPVNVQRKPFEGHMSPKHVPIWQYFNTQIFAGNKVKVVVYQDDPKFYCARWNQIIHCYSVSRTSCSITGERVS